MQKPPEGNFSVLEGVFAGPDFWVSVSGMADFSFKRSSLLDDEGAVNPVKDTSEGLLSACWYQVVKYRSTTMTVARMRKNCNFIFLQETAKYLLSSLCFKKSEPCLFHGEQRN